MKRLKHNLVGSWDSCVDEVPDLGSFDSWVRSNQNLVGNLHIKWLGSVLFLLVFYNVKDVKGVHNLGCSINGKSVKLDWWSPEARCLKERVSASETWVRVVGLPAHLWGMESSRQWTMLVEVLWVWMWKLRRNDTYSGLEFNYAPTGRECLGSYM